MDQIYFVAKAEALLQVVEILKRNMMNNNSESGQYSNIFRLLLRRYLMSTFEYRYKLNSFIK